MDDSDAKPCDRTYPHIGHRYEDLLVEGLVRWCNGEPAPNSHPGWPCKSAPESRWGKCGDVGPHPAHSWPDARVAGKRGSCAGVPEDAQPEADPWEERREFWAESLYNTFANEGGGPPRIWWSRLPGKRRAVWYRRAEATMRMADGEARDAATVLVETAEMLEKLAWQVERDLEENDYWCSDRPREEWYGNGMRNGMGGAAGELGAAMGPAVARALAAQFRATVQAVHGGWLGAVPPVTLSLARSLARELRVPLSPGVAPWRQPMPPHVET